ncbi:MAG: hypothetical protein ACFCD0_01055 [Gemmataceae bacterium]
MFARWGDNYAYHIGDLSPVVLPDHPPLKAKGKCRKWASTLFEEFPTDTPKLKETVYFWTKAWSPDEVGIWRDFQPTRLTFVEYLMIGVASAAYPDDLLNQEGQSRA